jgi:hypothetical protein
LLPRKSGLGSGWEAPTADFIDLRSERVVLTALAIVGGVVAIAAVWICIKEMEAADRSEDP